MILTTDRQPTNRERRAEWASRYLLSGGQMFSGFVSTAAFRREFEKCAAADLRDTVHGIDMEGYEHDRY